MANAGNWIGLYEGDWLGSVGAIDPNAMAGSAVFSIAATGTLTGEQLLTDTHDGFWRKQWEKKKKKPIVVEELAEFIEQVATKEIVKPKVIADTRLFELYRQSIEINQQIAEKLERIYQTELDDEDEAILMLLGVY